jgi:predicted P-loop ATPase
MSGAWSYEDAKEEIRLAGERPNGHAPEEEQSTPKRDSWLGSVQCDSRAEPRPNLFNCMLALREDPRISGLFAYDEMLRASTLMQPIPAETKPDQASYLFPRPVRDTDVGILQELLQRAGLEKIGKDVVHQAVDLRASECSFHPVGDYLNGIAWDGTPRLRTWLSVYLGAEANAYHCTIGEMFLVMMVARILRPGCKADYPAVRPITWSCSKGRKGH